MSPDIWTTSDTHFGHKKAMQFCPDSRPFSSVEEMDEAIIERWNEVVKPNDIIYHLGDLTWHKKDKIIEILSRLNGRKFMILGNHDQVVKNDRDVRDYFVQVRDYKEIYVDNQHICLFHFPITHWNKQHYSSMHFYGHLHSNEIGVNCLDIGADGNNLYPHNIRELIEKHHVNVESDPRVGRSKVR